VCNQYLQQLPHVFLHDHTGKQAKVENIKRNTENFHERQYLFFCCFIVYNRISLYLIWGLLEPVVTRKRKFCIIMIAVADIVHIVLKGASGMFHGIIIKVRN